MPPQAQFAVVSDTATRPANPFTAHSNTRKDGPDSSENYPNRVQALIFLFAGAGSWALFFVLVKSILGLIY